MTRASDQGEAWTLDVPGLTRAQADELVSFIQDSGMSDFATAVDPANFLTLHLDRETAASLRRAISRAGNTDRSPDSVDLAGLSEVLSDWLDHVADDSDR
ncbi:MAG: hypothetical protein GC157_16270 [Frankiales bacterium]|nr:hypothetical protein [Frankiales bacterium]